MARLSIDWACAAAQRLPLWVCVICLIFGTCSSEDCDGNGICEQSPCSGHGAFDTEWDECTCEKGYSGDDCESCSEGFAGWPRCAPIQVGEAGSELWGWSSLCPEVRKLRINLPEYIVKLGQLYAVRQSVTKSRTLQQHDYEKGPFMSRVQGPADCSSGSSTGPWRLKVDLAAPKHAPPALTKHHRILLIFGRDWPASLPKIRFLGKVGNAYVIRSDDKESFAQTLHTSEAGGLLLRRLQELVGASVTCMWRQTGGCSNDGANREPEKDQFCDETISVGLSGFCDCNGNGEKDASEPGYGCQESPGTCREVCAAVTSAGSNASESLQAEKAAPRHELSKVLHMIHQSLGGALHSGDKRIWTRSASEFAEEVSTVLRYEQHGRKHPPLFGIGGVPDSYMIDSSLRELLVKAQAQPSRSLARATLLSSGLIEQVVDGYVFTFRVFTPEFCQMLMEEIHHFYSSKLPARRPNSMNNYGIILNEIGLEPLVFTLQDVVIQPLAAMLLPEAGSELEAHHSFTIRYRGGEDTHLDVHTDDSDVTFNVNIFENYTGAPLIFCGINGAPDHRLFKVAHQHRLGHAVLHLGRHRHGAEDITSGERMNLVIWSYSHNYRSSSSSEKTHERELRQPDQRCVSYTHDRDFGRFRAWPEGKKERHLGQGWCPPRGKEYSGFVPDVADSDLPRRSPQGGS